MCVHTSHCCAVCGCKYGDEDCPVATRKEKAEYACQECADHKQYLVDALLALPRQDLKDIVLELLKHIK